MVAAIKIQAGLKGKDKPSIMKKNCVRLQGYKWDIISSHSFFRFSSSITCEILNDKDAIHNSIRYILVYVSLVVKFQINQ